MKILYIRFSDIARYSVSFHLAQYFTIKTVQTVLQIFFVFSE